MNGLRFPRPTPGHLLLAVLALTAASQVVVGFVLYRRLQGQLEADLARRLVHVARLLAQSVDAPLAVQLRPGDETLPAYAVVRGRLARGAGAAGVSRAYVVDAAGRTLVDTEAGQPIGRLRHALLANVVERDRALGGEAVPTRLYAGEDGGLRLSAFAPVPDRKGRTIALVGVDAAPEFFAALGALRREMLLLGTLGLALAAVAGLLVRRQVERRLRRLRRLAGGAAPEGVIADRAAADRTAAGRAAHEAVTDRPAAPPAMAPIAPALAAPAGADAIDALGRDLDRLVAAIVAARDHQQAILASLDVALLTTDAAGSVTLANPRAVALFDRPADALAGQPLEDLLGGEPELQAFAAAALSAPASKSVEVAWRGGPAAGGRLLTASASRLVEGGRAAGLVLSLLDVTELRGAERRARENERLAGLGGLAAGLLHELGSPLAALAMYLDLLRPLVPAGEGRQLVGLAAAEDARVSAFLEDFRVVSGLRPLRLAEVDLAAVVDEAGDLLRWPPEVARKVSGRGRALADARVLAHAVRNLLRNALEALPSGGTVEIEIGGRDGEGTIAVSDDGAGLPPGPAEAVLEPFRTTKAHGTGLGLWIARRAAELHGGTLEPSRRPERGARFVLRWPSAGTKEDAWRAS